MCELRCKAPIRTVMPTVTQTPGFHGLHSGGLRGLGLISFSLCASEGDAPEGDRDHFAA